MAAWQQARPSADVTIEGWSPPPLYERLDEAEPDDGDFVESPSDPEGATFEVRLSALAWPKTGTQTLRFRLRKTAAEDVPATVFLLQGNAILAFSRVEPTTAFATYALELSQEQVHAITDYTDLRVRVMAGIKKIVIPCCEVAVPEILYATVTNKSGDFVNAQDFVFEYVELSGVWRPTSDWAPSTSCGTDMTCIGGAPYFNFPAESGWTCDPVHWTFVLVNCGTGIGTCTVTVTETPP